MKSDKSCISNPKSRNFRLDGLNGGGLVVDRSLPWRVQFEISDFGFKMQDLSDFKIPLPALVVYGMVLLVSVAAWGHHGAAAEYDLQHPVMLKGVVTEFRYVNPHSQIYFDVTDSNGNVVNWAGELNSPYSLTQDGWTKKRSMEALKAGTPIAVIICPGKSGKPVGLAQKIFNFKGEQLLSETNTGLEPDRRPAPLK